MGRKSSSASAVALFVAFIEERVWGQAALARRLGIGVPTVRRLLSELQSAGCPLERDEEHPHVYWSVRKGWLPGGVALDGDDVRVALRLLARLPKSAARDRLLGILLRLSPSASRTIANQSPAVAEDRLEVIEDAASRRVALAFEYLSASTGEHARRMASVHRVEYGPHIRFIATCHREKVLKRFRLDSVTKATLDPADPFRGVDDTVLAAFVARSVDGFAGAGAPVACSFVVLPPAAAWARRNLPEGSMQVEHRRDGSIRVSAHTSATEVLARFVVGLGAAARAETPGLIDAVHALACGSLVAHERAAASLNDRAVVAIEASTDGLAPRARSAGRANDVGERAPR